MKKPKLKKKPKSKPPKQGRLTKLTKLVPKRGKGAEERVSEALQNVPRITNETVAEHREDVLSSARKYIYPLQHSKHRIVRVSVTLFVAVVILLFVYCGLALYSFQSNSSFVYGVTRVVPFPVAKAGGSWVSYESYLFELRRFIHYYQTQQQVDFSNRDGKTQLQRLKQQALNEVVQDAYVKQLANKYHVSVSGQAVDNEVTLLKNQNRLGDSTRVFDTVLNEYWGWNEADFKRELRQQLLQQAVVAKLDTATTTKAHSVLQQLQAGADFATLAKQYSDDASTAPNGGQYAGSITPNDANLSPQITAAIFQLKAGQTSTIINTGYTLDIVKVLTNNGAAATAAHIQFTFKSINNYIGPLEKAHPSHDYIKI